MKLAYVWCVGTGHDNCLWLSSGVPLDTIIGAKLARYHPRVSPLEMRGVEELEKSAQQNLSFLSFYYS